MDADTRTTLAYIIGRRIFPKEAVAIFDPSKNRDCRFVGNVSDGMINVRNLEKKVQLMSSSRGSSVLLYHMINDSHISLEITGTRFKGFDEKSEKHFEGWGVEPTIWFYDYEDRAYHRYVI